VPVNTYFEPPELEHVLRHSDCAIVLAQEHLVSHAYLEQLHAMCPELSSAPAGGLRSTAFPFLRLAIGVGIDEQRGAVVPWEAFLDAGSQVSDDIVYSFAAQVVPAVDGCFTSTSGMMA